MIYNKTFLSVLEKINVFNLSSKYPISLISYNNGFFIKNNRFKNCFDLNKFQTLSSQDLVELEWDINEIYIQGQSIEAVATKLLAISKLLKRQLSKTFSVNKFIIIGSLDDGLESGVCSGIVRFYAIRNNTTDMIDILNINNYTDPIFIEYIN